MKRLQQVFKLAGKEPSGVDCPAIDGIIEEADEVAGGNRTEVGARRRPSRPRRRSNIMKITRDANLDRVGEATLGHGERGGPGRCTQKLDEEEGNRQEADRDGRKAGSTRKAAEPGRRPPVTARTSPQRRHLGRQLSATKARRSARAERERASRGMGVRERRTRCP